jgi:hypothetical protein
MASTASVSRTPIRTTALNELQASAGRRTVKPDVRGVDRDLGGDHDLLLCRRRLRVVALHPPARNLDVGRVQVAEVDLARRHPRRLIGTSLAAPRKPVQRLAASRQLFDHRDHLACGRRAADDRYAARCRPLPPQRGGHRFSAWRVNRAEPPRHQITPAAGTCLQIGARYLTHAQTWPRRPPSRALRLVTEQRRARALADKRFRPSPSARTFVARRLFGVVCRRKRAPAAGHGSRSSLKRSFARFGSQRTPRRSAPPPSRLLRRSPAPQGTRRARHPTTGLRSHKPPSCQADVLSADPPGSLHIEATGLGVTGVQRAKQWPAPR